MLTLVDLLITLDTNDEAPRDVYTPLSEHIEDAGGAVRDQVLGYYPQGEHYVARAVLLFEGLGARDIDEHLEMLFGDRDEVLAYDQIGDTIEVSDEATFEAYVHDASEEDLPEDLRTDTDTDLYVEGD